MTGNDRVDVTGQNPQGNPRVEINLEIFRETPGRWVVRKFGGDPTRPPFIVGTIVEEVEEQAIALAKVIGAELNTDESCELNWRSSEDGTIWKKNTYGRDPETSKG